MMRGDWRHEAEQYRDIDRAAQREAEAAIAARRSRPRFRFRYWQGVKYVARGHEAPATFTRCGHCGRAWDNERASAWTPTHGPRCPFEYWHRGAS